MNRIRSSRNFRTAAHTIVDINFVGVVRRIFIKNPNLLGEIRTRNKRHQEAVLLPNITQRGVNITMTGIILEVGNHINGSTFANIHIGGVIAIDAVRQHNSVNNRIRNHNRVRITRSGTTRKIVRHINSKDSLVRFNISGINAFSSVRNNAVVAIGDFMPLINERPHIVITEVSSSSNLTTLTNRVIVKRNSNTNGISNIDIVRITFSDTTIFIGSESREDVRMILSLQRSIQGIVADEGNFNILTINHIVTILERVIVQTPSIGVVMIASRRICSVIDESIELSNTVVANQRIARDLDSRVTQHNQSIRFGNRIRNATALIDSLKVVDIHTRGIRHNGKRGEVFTNDFNTINIPEVSGVISRSSGDNRLCTLANRIVTNDCGIRSLRKIEDNNLNGINTLTRSIVNATSRSNRRGNHICSSLSRSNIHGRICSIVGIGTPFIGHIASPTVSIDIQCNMFTLADSRTGSGNLNI